MDLKVTALSETRFRVQAGKQIFYLKRLRAASEDYDAWNRTGTPSLWEVDDGETIRRVRWLHTANATRPRPRM